MELGIEPSRDDLAEAVGAIWRSAGEPEHWNSALTRIKRLTPHSAGLLIYTPFVLERGALWSTLDAPEGFLDEYIERWQGRDVSLHALARRMPTEKLAFDLNDLIPDPDLSPIWQQLYRLRGIDDMSGIIVNGMGPDSAEAVLFAIFAPELHPDIRDNRRRVLRAIGDHLLGAAALHWRLVHAESVSAASKSLLDRIALGTVILSGAGKVLYVNGAARRMIEAGDALRLRAGKLTALSAGTDQVLQRLPKAMAAGGTERPFLIPRNSGSITAIAAPAEADTALGDIGKASCILFLSDPSEVARSAGRRLAELYALSPSEAEIAQAIAEGHDVARIARARNSSIHTVRSQLRATMSKIGAKRQSDVVRAVLATAILEARP